MEEPKILLYVKPVMAIDQKRRYIRLDPDDFKDLLRHDMYQDQSTEYATIVELRITDGYPKLDVAIAIEHSKIQRKTVDSIERDWIEWYNSMLYELGLDGEIEM